MYSPGPFSEPIGSFRWPVDPPASQPDSAPLQSICVNQDWLPFIAGALKQLSLQSTWNFPDDAALLDIQGRVFNLISLFQKLDFGCCSDAPTRLCLSGTFSDEDYGYFPQTGFDCVNIWTPGTGWESCHDISTNTPQIHIERVFSAPTLVRSLSYHVNAAVGSPAYDITAIYSLGGSVVGTATVHIITGGGTLTDSPGLNMDDVIVEVVSSSPSSLNFALDDWSMCYDGPFPLSNVPQGTFTHVFDFTVADGSFTRLSNPPDPNTGAWVSGVGWESETNHHSGFDDTLLYIGRAFSERKITRVTLEYSCLEISHGATRVLTGELGGTVVTSVGLDSGAGTFTEDWFPNVFLDDLVIDIGTTSVSSTSNINIATKITVSGLGSDPF